jgi:hypothetical protein
VETPHDEEPLATVVEFLHGIGGRLMSIDAKLSQIVYLLGGEDDEEEVDA